MQSFLVLDSNIEDETRILQLLLLYAVFTATNIIRFRQVCVERPCVGELPLQILHQGAAQSSRAEHAVRNAWATQQPKRARASESN